MSRDLLRALRPALRVDRQLGQLSGGSNSLNAGAVAARCYAIAKLNAAAGNSTYDICATTSCQVYNRPILTSPTPIPQCITPTTGSCSQPARFPARNIRRKTTPSAIPAAIAGRSPPAGASSTPSAPGRPATVMAVGCASGAVLAGPRDAGWPIAPAATAPPTGTPAATGGGSSSITTPTTPW